MGKKSQIHTYKQIHKKNVTVSAKAEIFCLTPKSFSAIFSTVDYFFWGKELQLIPGPLNKRSVKEEHNTLFF
jgi:hypothetical protein